MKSGSKRKMSSFRASSVQRLLSKAIPEADENTVYIPGSYESCYFGKRNENFYSEEKMNNIISEKNFRLVLDQCGLIMGQAKMDFKKLNKIEKSNWVFVGMGALVLVFLFTSIMLKESVTHDNRTLFSTGMFLDVFTAIIPFCFMIWNYIEEPREKVRLRNLVSTELSKYIEDLNHRFREKMTFSFNSDKCFLTVKIDKKH